MLEVYIEVYIDESGTHDDKFLVVAAYVSEVERWVSFSQEWKKILDDHSLPYFHMKDFRSPQSRAYRHLTSRDKEDLIDALIDVIHRNVLFGVVVSGSPRLYKRLATPVYRSRHGSCYNLCVRGCLNLAFHFLRGPDSSAETVGIFVEEGHKNGREVIGALGEFKRDTDPIELPDDLDGALYGGPLDIPRDLYSGKDDPLRKRGLKVGAYGLGSKKTMLPLQAADVLAYCAHGLGRRHNVQFCLGALKKLGRHVPHYGGVCGKELILEVIKDDQNDTAVRAKQRHDYYMLGKQLRACGFEVERVPAGLSVKGSKAKMAAFAMINGMKPVEGG